MTVKCGNAKYNLCIPLSHTHAIVNTRVYACKHTHREKSSKKIFIDICKCV